jgi:hypothetical protein
LYAAAWVLRNLCACFPDLYRLIRRTILTHEQHNLADSEPEQLARMQVVIAEGQKDWSVPGWPQFIAAPIAVDKHLAQPVTTEDEFVY